LIVFNDLPFSQNFEHFRNKYHLNIILPLLKHFRKCQIYANPCDTYTSHQHTHTERHINIDTHRHIKIETDRDKLKHTSPLPYTHVRSHISNCWYRFKEDRQKNTSLFYSTNGFIFNCLETGKIGLYQKTKPPLHS